MLNRLSHWIESNNILCDEQNGFHSGRCTIDHVGSLTRIIETRMKKKSDTFVAFIDYSKAYDRINRQLLWYNLSRLGISDQFIHVLKSLYSKVQCTAKINGFVTDWFNVSVGLKQGCILSPVLFNRFMDDLVQMIREQKKGVTYGYVNVSILLYADDIVLLLTSLIHSTSHVIAYYLLFNTMYNYGIHTTTNVFCIPTQLYHITYHLIFHTWRLHGEHIHNKRKHKLVHKCIGV